MTGLRKKSGESVFLGILQEAQFLYLDKRDGHDDPIKFATETGTRRELIESVCETAKKISVGAGHKKE